MGRTAEGRKRSSDGGAQDRHDSGDDLDDVNGTRDSADLRSMGVKLDGNFNFEDTRGLDSPEELPGRNKDGLGLEYGSQSLEAKERSISRARIPATGKYSKI